MSSGEEPHHTDYCDSSWNLCGDFLLGARIGKRRGVVTRGEEPHHTGRFL